MSALLLSLLLLGGGGGSGRGTTYCTPDREGTCMHCDAAVKAAAIPACVPSGTNYLPTPSPCRVVITDPITGEPDLLVLRFMVTKPKPLKPGKWPLQDFHADQRKRKGWVKVLVLAVLL